MKSMIKAVEFLEKEKEAFLVACGEEAKNLYWDSKYEMFLMKKDIGLSHQDWLTRSVANASAWHMWLESAKAKQAEINELNAKLETAQVPEGFVLVPIS